MCIDSPFIMRHHLYPTDTRPARVSHLVCKPLEDAGFVNGFSLRAGGVSPMPKDALNLSYREDVKENVDENRKRFLAAMAQPKMAIVTAIQVHSDKCLFIPPLSRSLSRKGMGKWEDALPTPEVDAMASRNGNLFLGIQTADCVPILLADPLTELYAGIHAGWRGTLLRITEKTIGELARTRQVDPSNLIAAVGPSACGKCFEVGADVSKQFKKEFSYGDQLFTPHLDTVKGNVQQLLDAGVRLGNIHVAPYCTMHQNTLFFSFRRESRDGTIPVGRQLSVIGIKN